MITAKVQELVERRVSKGWNRTDLAKKAGIHQPEVSRAEKGKSMSPRVAKAISDAFGVPVTELFTISRKREA